MYDQVEFHKQVVTALQEQGFLFQKKCLEEIRTYAKGYFFESEEFPVSLGAKETVIDFVFRSTQTTGVYLVFECKRAHPNYVSWVFAKPQRTEPNPPRALLTAVRLDPVRGTSGWVQTMEVDLLKGGPQVYVSVGLEVSNKGPKHGRSGKADIIHGACTQVLTGVGGLALEHKKRMGPHNSQRTIYIPVIITSANLFLTTYNLEAVEIISGDIASDKASTEPIDWVVFDFAVPEALQVTSPTECFSTAMGPSEPYRRLFKAKSVAIVQSVKVPAFLAQLNCSTWTS